MSVNSVLCATILSPITGRIRLDHLFQIQHEVNKKSQNLNELTRLFVQGARYETRLQILHFLFGIANADGHIAEIEIQKFNKLPVL